ncbi:MAG: autotransporter assembly complex protein TamA [Woeseiaceae bacterium]
MRLPKFLLRSIFALLLTTTLILPSYADGDLQYVVRGVDDPLRSNILNHITSLRFGRQTQPAEKDFERIIAESISDAKEALRPYGYYAADIDGRIIRESNGQPTLELNVSPGPPIVIDSLQLEIVGGVKSQSLDRWKRNWPLLEGKILDQVIWKTQKQQVMEICNSIGFLGAEFTTHTLEIDLETNRANVMLVLETGQRYVMGDVDFGEHVLNPGILEFVPRFEKGDPYSLHLMDQFRSDLWQSGYFTDVDVVQVEIADAEPPRVDLQVRTSTDYRNRYTGSLGFGSDTGLRLQANWNRHPMSARGDRLDLGIGWQELDDQFAVRATYRLPRKQRNREYWTVDTVLNYENMDLEFKLNPEDDDFVKFARGDVDERHVRFGRLKIRNFGGGETQLFATPFVQYINSQYRFSPILQPTIPVNDPSLDKLLRGVDDAISVGIEYGLVNVLGKGFNIRGHRERAWVFHANDSFGSEIEFTQAYISTNSSYRFGDRWKFIFRAEAGYTEAKVSEFTIDIGGGQLDISNTELPSFYRFKAGGSNSVRGYGFETLSNNDIGSNHILSASAEIEMKVLEKWSAAFFVDTGNAFNDWSKPELKTGVGLGIRWYSIAGPIRVDVAQALDYTDDPWRVHFTIGVPLL